MQRSSSSSRVTPPSMTHYLYYLRQPRCVCMILNNNCYQSFRQIVTIIVLFATFGLFWNGPESFLFFTSHVFIAFFGGIFIIVAMIKDEIKKAKCSCCSLFILLLLLFIPFAILWSFCAMMLYIIKWLWDELEIARFKKISSDKYLQSLIAYSMNGIDDNSIIKRMTTINYYFSAFLLKKDQKYIQSFNHIAKIHNNNPESFKCSDCVSSHDLNAVVMCIFILFNQILIIYGSLIWNYIKAEDDQYIVPLWCIITIVIWTVIEIINIMNDIKCSQIYWYCSHLLPFIKNPQEMEKVGNQFKTVQNMMDTIDTMYTIMFHSAYTELIKCTPLDADVSRIIQSYLWSELPDYDLNVSKKLNNLILKHNPAVQINEVEISIKGKDKNIHIELNN